MLLLLACHSPDSGTAPTDTSSSDLRPGLAGLDDLGAKNLILLHTDTLRADRLPTYGSVHDTLPETGGGPWMTVDGMFAASSWTVPSTPSMFTGLDVHHHGVTRMLPDHVPSAEVTAETITERLSDEGFATFAGAGSTVVQVIPGLSDGFDEVTERPDQGGDSRLTGLEGSASEWIDGVPEDQRFFLFFQSTEPHAPYQAYENLGTWSDPDAIPFDLSEREEEQLPDWIAAYDVAATDEDRAAMVENLKSLYDETILVLDHGFAQLLEHLDERGRLDDTLIVFTSDHGETVGDDAYNVVFGHGNTVRPELTHIPLMFRHPRLAAQDVACVGQNFDLVPTLLQALGVDPLADVDGAPLQDGCRALVHSVTYANDTDDERIRELMVTDGEGMLRWNCERGAVYRHDLTTDPDGQVELAREDTPGIEALEAEMERVYAEIRAEQGVDECVVN